MNKVYVLQRVLNASTGNGSLVVPVKAFDNEAAGKDAGELRTKALRALLGCRLVREVGHGQGEDTGMTVAQFLGELGIGGFQHFISAWDVHAGELVAPPPSPIFIPGRH